MTVDARTGIKSPDTTAVGVSGLDVPPERRFIRISPLPALTGHKVLVIDETQASVDYAPLLAKWKQLHAR